MGNDLAESQYKTIFTSSLDLATFDMDCLPKDNCVILYCIRVSTGKTKDSVNHSMIILALNLEFTSPHD